MSGGGPPMASGTQERPRNIPPKLLWHPQPLPTPLPNDHEYHEISDEENLVAESPRFVVNAFSFKDNILLKIINFNLVCLL